MTKAVEKKQRVRVVNREGHEAFPWPEHVKDWIAAGYWVADV